MPKLPFPEPPPPPDLALPLRLFRKLVKNTKDALKDAKAGVKELADEIKKPMDHP